jgi:protein SCO1/2
MGAVEAGVDVSKESGISQEEANLKYFTDLEVISHKGEKLRFYSDLLRDKLVVISFYYVNCPTAPAGMASLFRLQNLLGDRLGRDVFLISISVDPERDTVAAVQEYAAKFNPKEGWVFITGDKENLDVINRKLGNTLRLPEGHLRLFLLGNLKEGNWMKMLETAPASSLLDGLRSLKGESQS